MLGKIKGELPCKGRRAKSRGNSKARRAVPSPARGPVPPRQKTESRVGLVAQGWPDTLAATPQVWGPASPGTRLGRTCPQGAQARTTGGVSAGPDSWARVMLLPAPSPSRAAFRAVGSKVGHLHQIRADPWRGQPKPWGEEGAGEEECAERCYRTITACWGTQGLGGLSILFTKPTNTYLMTFRSILQYSTLG